MPPILTFPMPTCSAVPSRHQWGRRIGVFALVGALALSSRAAAQSVDAQRFHPAAGPQDVLSVRAASAGGHGWWRAGFSLNYANAPVLSPAGGAASPTRLVEHQATVEAFAALRWADRFEFGASLPATLQSTNADIRGGIVAPAGGGLGDLRLLPKVQLAGFGGFSAALALPIVIGTGRREALLGERAAVVLQPRLVVEQAFAFGRVLADAGPDLRAGGMASALGSELAFGMAVEYRIRPGNKPLSAILALNGGVPLRARAARQLELLAGVVWGVSEGMSLQLGAGPGLFSGSGTPGARVVTTLSWTSPAQAREHGVAAERVADPPPALAASAAPATPPAPAPLLALSADPTPASVPVQCPAAAPAAEWSGDSDADGIDDEIDHCPKEAETYDGTADGDGCPEPGAKAGLVEFRREREVVLKIAIKVQVHFAQEADRVLPDSFPLLDQISAVMRSHPEILKVRVEGHTDADGNEKTNADLSLKRARSVVAQLSTRGVLSSRLEAVGLGATRPIADNATQEGRSHNRRVEFVVVPAGP